MKRVLSFLITLALSGVAMLSISIDKTGAMYEDIPPLIINGLDVNKKENLQFQETRTLFKSSEEYGKYDIYVDSNNNEYTYLHGTSKFCGFYISNYSSGRYDPNKHLTEEDIINIAKKCLNDLIGIDNNYLFTECFYAEQAKLYEVTYNYRIGNNKTDDEVYMQISSFGEVLCMSAFNRGRYDNYDSGKIINKVDRIDTSGKITSSIGTKDYTILDEYITKNETDNLVLRYKVSFKDRVDIVDVSLK